MFKPRRVGLVSLIDRPDLFDSIERMKECLAERGMEYVEIKDKSWFDGDCREVDLLVTFGGDGTLLSVSSLAAQKDLPLAGVNVGRLGFLTTCSRTQIEEFADALQQGTCVIDCRTMLEVQRFSEDGSLADARRLALNEVSLMRVETGKMIDLEAVVDGMLLNRYHADGILISTPTGSSAYSLSAGGPLVWPDSNVICVTPVCPHSLTNRAVILPGDVKICLKPRPRRGRTSVMSYSADGRDTYPLEVGDSLVVGKAPECLKLVHLPDWHFAELLRVKLRWQGAELP